MDAEVRSVEFLTSQFRWLAFLISLRRNRESTYTGAVSGPAVPTRPFGLRRSLIEFDISAMPLRGLLY